MLCHSVINFFFVILLFLLLGCLLGRRWTRTYSQEPTVRVLFGNARSARDEMTAYKSLPTANEVHDTPDFYLLLPFFNPRSIFLKI